MTRWKILLIMNRGVKENLLDTHTILWYLEGSDRLSNKVKLTIDNKETINYVSIASLWEIAIKLSIHKIVLGLTLSELLAKITEIGFEILPVSTTDVFLISTLPFHHRDPFDRMLIAQAIQHKLLLLSNDKIFSSYLPNVLW